jgi:hypothetical protein
MTHTVEIESARTVDLHGLLRALRSDGLVGEVVEIGRRFRLFVEGEDDATPVALTEVEHAVERWLDEHHVELLAQRVGEDSLVLRPAAA